MNQQTAPEEVVRFKGKYLTLVTKPGPNGQTFECVTARPGVSVIIVPKPGMVRFITEYDAVREQHRIKPVSAYVEDGESPLECARRELKAEVGLTAKHWGCFHAHRVGGTIAKTQHYFTAEGLTEGEANPDRNEDIYGSKDFTLSQVMSEAVAGTLGSGETAFALMKYVLQYGK